MTAHFIEDGHSRCPARLRFVWTILNEAGDVLDYGRAPSQADAEGQANRALTRLRGVK